LISTLFDQVKDLGWIQWVAFLTGLAYIYFATKNDARCWPWGIVSSCLWAYSSFYELKLYSDGWLQVLYIFLGCFGWYRWYKNTTNEVLAITRLNINQWIIYLFVGSALALLIGFQMKKTNASFPMADAYLSVFSVIATILLINRKIENWWWWIVIDLVNIPLFIIRKGYLFAVLFLIYSVLAVRGLQDWNKKIAIKN
jgi:nicotinamide mononucleotide transporter